MKFEVINDDGTTVMFTTDVLCIPNSAQLNSMGQAGYKFKIDGKIVGRKKIDEYININK